MFKKIKLIFINVARDYLNRVFISYRHTPGKKNNKIRKPIASDSLSETQIPPLFVLSINQYQDRCTNNAFVQKLVLIFMRRL